MIFAIFSLKTGEKTSQKRPNCARSHHHEFFSSHRISLIFWLYVHNVDISRPFFIFWIKKIAIFFWPPTPQGVSERGSRSGLEKKKKKKKKVKKKKKLSTIFFHRPPPGGVECWGSNFSCQNENIHIYVWFGTIFEGLWPIVPICAAK